MIPADLETSIRWRRSPPPLLAPEQNVMVIWSAKCACTTVFLWFINALGLLDDFRSQHVTPHQYRRFNYAKSQLYRRARSKPVGDYHIVHVIRDPYTRAVSSYRHALTTRYCEGQLMRLPRPLDRHEGFSFSQYLDFLSAFDLERANVHHRLQLHPLELAHAPHRIINVSKQDLYAELNRLERDFGMAQTDFKQLTWLHDYERNRRPHPHPFTGSDAPDASFDVAAGKGLRPWPDYGQFLTDSTRRRIERLYTLDFKAFGAFL